MNGFRGMGEKPIKVMIQIIITSGISLYLYLYLYCQVSMAIPKTRAEEVVLGDREGGAKQYSYFYEQYWADQVGQGGGPSGLLVEILTVRSEINLDCDSKR